MRRGFVIFFIAIVALGAVLVVRHRAKVQSQNPDYPTFGGAPLASSSDDVSGGTDNTNIPVNTNTPPSTTGTTPPPTSTKGASYTPGTFNGSLKTADGRTRTYLIHIPTGYTAAKNYPLVFAFHGGNGTGAKILEQTQFEKKADSAGFIVVAADGYQHNWNDGRGTTEAELAGVDDVAFMRQLVADLSNKLPIDLKRVYATGPSNGGLFSERLGCDAADVFAAIGPVVGPLPSNYAPKCNPSNPISVVGIQGGADPAININGGEATSAFFRNAADGGSVLSAVDTMQLWATKNKCNTTPAIVHQTPTVSDGTSVDQYTFSGCSSGTSVVYYIVQGMGHGWPPNPPQSARLSGPTSHNINATDVVWAFFAAHHK